MSHGGDAGEHPEPGGTEQAKHQGSPLPVFPSHFSQWFLHYVPERKSHDGKLQITPSPLLVTNGCQLQNLFRGCRLVLAL